MRAAAPEVTAYLTAVYGPKDTVTERPCGQVLRVLQYMADSDTLMGRVHRELSKPK
jgi:hypothetical protein